MTRRKVRGAAVVGKLEDRVAVITGGGRGIGLAMANSFAAEAAKVVITGRRQETLDDALRENGTTAVGVRGDVGKLDDLARLTDDVRRGPASGWQMHPESPLLFT